MNQIEINKIEEVKTCKWLMDSMGGCIDHDCKKCHPSQMKELKEKMDKLDL